MEVYVGLYDYECFSILKDEKVKEVNFWRPGATSFRAVHQNELFLFKLKKPESAIVGGGFFVGYSRMPIERAWDTFGVENGARSFEEFKGRVGKYQQKRGMVSINSEIGCIVLADPFFFEKDQWITGLEEWSDSIVTGKKYNTRSGEGLRILEEVLQRLGKSERELAGRQHSLEEGAFQMLVMDAYDRTCAVSGSKTLPVLRAAHLRPLEEGGANQIDNGIFLRTDLATLLEKGWMTIDSEYRIHLTAEFVKTYGEENEYMKYEGESLVMLPDNMFSRPSRDNLEWELDLMTPEFL